MADRQPEPGVITLRAPIFVGGKLQRALFCRHWLFQTAAELEIATWQPRVPVLQTWFAVACGEPVSDPERPGTVSAPTLVLIPAENVLGFAACNKAPPKAARLDSEAAPA